MWDYDEGNGNYDVETGSDHERWRDERIREEDRIRRENATEEELKDPYFDVPF